MKCPGQDSRYWKESAIFETACPACGQAVEFFKDDTTRKCGHCGHRFINPRMDFGCASYCPYAEQCIGDLPPELLALKADFLKDRVAVAMKRYFKTDFKRIGHASRVARYAERIGKEIKANLPVVLCAAYLHDIGLIEAQRKTGHADRDHEAEGVPVARDILASLGAPAGLTEAVVDIVGRHHHAGVDETNDFKAVYDADLIVNLEEKNNSAPMSPESLAALIEKRFLSMEGRELACTVLLNR